MKKKINKKESRVGSVFAKKNISVSERHFGVVLEDIDSKLDIVVEGHQALDKKIEDFKNETGERFDEVDYKFEIVFEKFDEIDTRFKSVDARFDEVDARFDKIDIRFGEVDARFDKIDIRFGEVDARLDKVDTRFSGVDTQLKSVDVRFNEMGVYFNDVKDELHIIRNELKEKVSRSEFSLLEKRVQ
jgi:archaellum component FlaC